MAAAIRVRETRRVAGQLNWLHPFRHHAFSSITWQRWRDSNPRGRGFGDRRSAAELHLFRNTKTSKRKSRLGRFRAACLSWGLSSVVSRHRQPHLAAREGTEHRAAQPILAAVFGERWNVHHNEHGGELLRGALHEVNRNQRKQTVCDADHSAAAAISPLIRRPSLLALTRTVSPSLMRPARMRPASGFCSSRWITRFSGRAP